MSSVIRGSDNFDSGEKLTLTTAINTTSGNFFDFTGLPSWVQRITVIFSGVSSSGTSVPQIQLGTSAGFTITGYDSAVMWGSSANASSTGLLLGGGSATDTRSGSLIITKLNGNQYSSFGVCKVSTTTVMSGGGSVTLPGVLDRLRIIHVNGTDTFDAGIINIMYE